MMASRRLELIAFPTVPNPLIGIRQHITKLCPNQRISLSPFLINCRLPVWRDTPRIGKNNRKVTPQQHNQLRNQEKKFQITISLHSHTKKPHLINPSHQLYNFKQHPALGTSQNEFPHTHFKLHAQLLRKLTRQYHH